MKRVDMPSPPSATDPEKAGDFDEFWHWNEIALQKKIDKLPWHELLGSRASLISRLRPTLLVQMPIVHFQKATRRTDFSADGEVATVSVSAEIPIEDPQWVSPYVTWPGSSDLSDYDASPEAGKLKVAASYVEFSVERAQERFDLALEKFKSNIDRVAEELERYNAALPYLISLYAEHRLDRIPAR